MQRSQSNAHITAQCRDRLGFLSASIPLKVILTGIYLLCAQQAVAQCEQPRCEEPMFQMQSQTDAKDYVFGIRRFNNEQNQIITGWQLNSRWYLGHERRNISDFGLVRHGERSAFSIGNKGVQMTLKF